MSKGKISDSNGFKKNGVAGYFELKQRKGMLVPEINSSLSMGRDRFLLTFGQVVIAFMSLDRYRHRSIGELSYMLLDPLIRNRISISPPRPNTKVKNSAHAGIAVWASVSKEVDKKIRDQIISGSSPVILKADEWDCGDIVWILEMIGPTPHAVNSVVVICCQSVRDGTLNVHPNVEHLISSDVLEEIGITLQVCREGCVDPGENDAEL